MKKPRQYTLPFPKPQTNKAGQPKLPPGSLTPEQAAERKREGDRVRQAMRRARMTDEDKKHRREWAREWANKNREHVRGMAKKIYHRDLEHSRAMKRKATRKFRDEHKEELRAARHTPEFRAKSREKQRRIRATSPTYKTKRHAYYKKNKDHIIKTGREWRRNNRDRHNKRQREWHAKNPGKGYAAYRRWAARYPEKAAANAYVGSAKRRATKRNATPKWVDAKALRRVYLSCAHANKMSPVKLAVDHIVPLKNSRVCGLHVPWNLRIITARENIQKKNKFIESMAIAPTPANGMLVVSI